jgi:hypothetical protein
MKTKEHFEFIAALIHSAKRGTSAYCLALIADAKFKSDDPSFDSEKFLKACGVEMKPEKGTAVALPPELKTVVPFPASPPPNFYADAKAEFERDYSN